MPNLNEDIVIAYETQSEFDELETKDENAIYFITDTGRIYVGNTLYYANVLKQSDIVVCTESEYNTMEQRTGLLYFITEGAST